MEETDEPVPGAFLVAAIFLMEKEKMGLKYLSMIKGKGSPPRDLRKKERGLLNQVYRTETIARARIHVERAIRRMKKFKISDFIPYTLQQHASYVVQVIGALTNLQPPLIEEVKESYTSTETD
ncbi:hypothetical protein JTB14_010684 [Gonioctena quinquepunctata]|nr:hypothetical protein JTB14_010684 [Gonioctena quinquepunctata]